MTYKEVISSIKLDNFKDKDGKFDKRKFRRLKRMSDRYASKLLKPYVSKALSGKYTGFKGKLILAKHAMSNLPDIIRANRIKKRINKLQSKYIDKVDNR